VFENQVGAPGLGRIDEGTIQDGEIERISRHSGGSRWVSPLALIGLVIAGWFAFRSWAGDAAHWRAAMGATLIGIADRPAGKLLVVLFYALAGALFVPVTLDGASMAQEATPC